MHVSKDRQITNNGYVVSHEHAVCVSVCVLGRWDDYCVGALAG